MKFVIFDIEADGLVPTKIHCMSKMDGGKLLSTVDYDKMRKLLSSDVYLVGHNIIRWDIPQLERLLGIKCKAKLVDTLALSWYLFPKEKLHGLEYWGNKLGIPKPPIKDWDNLPIKEYIHRCESDVKINTLLWNLQWKMLLKLYGDEDKALRLIDYLTFKLSCAAIQERLRWKLDIPTCEAGLALLEPLADDKRNKLAAIMPPVIKTTKKSKPKKCFKKDGSHSAIGATWFKLLEQHGLPEEYNGVVEVPAGEEVANPNSSDQIKSWLYGLGWIPETFKFVRNKETGDVRKIPQVNLPFGGGLCHSVKRLAKDHEGVAIFDGLSVLNHRISLLKGFLKNVDEDGYLQAKVSGFTNTLRFKHEVIVNLPGIDKAYGKLVRSCLVAPEGYELCGSDCCSLEDRTKQHYMWKHDPAYVKEMMSDDFDPHIDLAEFAGKMSKDDAHGFRQGIEAYTENKALKAIRKTYKSVNYAAVYGAGGPTVARTAGVPEHEGYTLVEAYWKRNWAVNAIAEECTVKNIKGQLWLYNPVSQLWYSLRYQKDRFSTLNQGTGVYCFDTWVKHCLSKNVPIIGQMHDEIIACIRKGKRDKATKVLKWAINEVNKELKLNRDLDVDVQFGNTYADIH